MQVSTLSMVFMAVSAVISIGLPVALFIFIYKKYNAKFMPMIAGVAAFVIFALVLEQAVHAAVLGRTAIMQNMPLYILYGVFMAGIFEETARFITFKIFKKTLEKKYRGIETGLSYGVGHGGIEAILLAGTTMIGNIIFSVTINSGNVETLTSKLDGNALANMNYAINALVTTAPYVFAFSGMERMMSITVHIALSILVFYSVYKEKLWLFPLAIVLHAIVDVPSMLFQTGIIKSILLVEGIVFVCMVLLVIFTLYLHKKFKDGGNSSDVMRETTG
jgi:uncharacterized membrane protein YhfC